MRSWILLIVLSAMLLLVAACGDDDATDDAPVEEDTAAEVEPTETPEPEPTETPEPEPTETPEPEPTATPEPVEEEADDADDDPRTARDNGDLEALLISLDDLPEGWMQVDDDFLDDDEFAADVSDDPFDAPCGIEPLDESIEPVAETDREFEGSELGPYLFQNLMQMGSAADAEEAMSVMRELFGCEEWTETDEFGDEVTFTIEEVPMEGVGDDAFAIKLGLTFEGLSEEEAAMMDMFGEFDFDLVVLQRGEYVTMLMYFDIFGMSDVDFDSLVRIADEKLQGAS